MRYAPDTRKRCSKCGFYLYLDEDNLMQMTLNDGRVFFFHYPQCAESIVGKNVRSVDIKIQEKKVGNLRPLQERH